MIYIFVLRSNKYNSFHQMIKSYIKIIEAILKGDHDIEYRIIVITFVNY